MKTLLWIEEILKEFSFVNWDRFTRHKKYLCVYGWIEREKDSYKDFIVVIFLSKEKKYKVISTSTLLHHDDIAKLVHEKMVTCERVEDNFLIKNCVKLKDK